MVLGYCVVCKARRELSDAKHVQRSGLATMEAKCTVCGTKTFVLGAETPTTEEPHEEDYA